MCYGDSGMEINWAIYGGAFCAGALATVLVQWVWGEVCWRLDRRSVVMPSFDEALIQKAALDTLVSLIASECDRGDEMPPTPVPTGGRSNDEVIS
jgi:hypothetical protein